ncbi:MAG: hypothetical protein KGI27_00510 [Thaumarchaeota archaeon]|nr:hypothetical protein [Nitrososphaerota archaeon]
MESPRLTIISLAALAIVVSVYAFLLIKNQPIRPQVCNGSESTDCIYSFGMWLDNKNRNYNAFPIINKVNKPVEFDGIRFVYTGSSTPKIDGINCDNVFPRAINSTTGHHPPIIVNYDGYFHVNETRHFTATLADGQVKTLTVCWRGNAMPKVIQMSEDFGTGGPMLCPSKTDWFDENKTAGITQEEYCSLNSPTHDRYIAEIGK